MNLVPIDEVIERWVRAHKEILAVQDSDFDWWREALANLRHWPPQPRTTRASTTRTHRALYLLVRVR